MASIEVRRDRGYNREAQRILKEPRVGAFLGQIAKRVKENAGEGHRTKVQVYGDRYVAEVTAWTVEARVAEARDKTLSKAFAAERKQPRRYL